MVFRIYTSLFTLAICCVTASATVTINLQIGRMTSSDSATLPGGTLWALISQNSSGNMPGGLLADNSLFFNNDPQSIMDDFAGVTITEGSTIGGGHVIATGGSTITSSAFGEGFIDGAINTFDFISAGLSVGDKLGVYWFPGLTQASNTLPSDSFEIGGFQSIVTSVNSGGNNALVIPSDGYTVSVAYLDNVITGGGSGIDQQNFEAISVVPEPSTLLFLSSGALLLLLRRRR